MFVQPAFEIKTFASPTAMLQLYERLQRYVDREHKVQRWWTSRCVRTTLTVRQMHERLQLRSTRVLLRYVCLDLIPAKAVEARRVRQ